MQHRLWAIAAGLLGALLLASGVLAEGADFEFHGQSGTASWRAQADDVTPDGGGPAVRQLSPGNRKIAESLYRAQVGEAGQRSLEQIAAAKLQGASWSEIFRQMKGAGLLRERNLGQVISTYRPEPGKAVADHADPDGPPREQPFVSTADMREPAILMEPAPSLPRSGPAAGGPSFEHLSPGNQKIAMSLFAAQRGSSGMRSLEEIASAKSKGTRWSEIFKAMKAEGLVAERNLGQVINRHAGRDEPAAPAADQEIVVRSPARLYADARVRALIRRKAAPPVPRSRVKPVARAPISEFVDIVATSDPKVVEPLPARRTAGKGPGLRYLPSLRSQVQLAYRPGAQRLAASQADGAARQER